MFGLRASAMVSAVTGSKRTLVAVYVLEKCAPGYSYSPLNPDQKRLTESRCFFQECVLEEFLEETP